VPPFSAKILVLCIRQRLGDHYERIGIVSKAALMDECRSFQQHMYTAGQQRSQHPTTERAFWQQTLNDPNRQLNHPNFCKLGEVRAIRAWSLQSPS
jgi:hypothetical protein